VALLGYGLAGRSFHGPLLRATPGMMVAAIVVADAVRRTQAEQDFPRALLLPSADEVWNNPTQFDLVVVATPPGSHVQLCSAAIAAGLAVVVEKPLATNAADARVLVERATAAGTMLVPFHNRRWDSDQLTLRRLRAAGALGEVAAYESRFERWRPDPRPGAWREALPAAAGGGVLLDLGVHLVDQALCLFGRAVEVDAHVEARRGGADDDVFMVLRHESGTRSCLWASAVCAAPGPRLRVLGSRAAYVVDHLDGQEDALRGGADPAQPGFGAEPRDRWGRLVSGDVSEVVPSEPGRWPDFYPAVAAAVRNGAPPPVLAQAAVDALEVLDAARHSAQGHDTVRIRAAAARGGNR
jgi:predicted dehydrogenase